MHCPGPLRNATHPIHEQWLSAQTTFFRDRAIVATCQNDPQLTILTYNTRHMMSLLERCAERIGIDVVVLGRGVRTWKWEYKIWLVQDYLASASPTNYVMCLDADDVMLLACPDVILQRYTATGANILFSSTAWDWPRSGECSTFEAHVAPHATAAHRHLNSGAYIGDARYVLERLDEIADAIASGAAWCRAGHAFDDQLAWRQLHRRDFPDIRIDTSCSLFVRFDAHR